MKTRIWWRARRDLGWLVLACLCWVAGQHPARADYADLIRRFEGMRTNSVWPVQGSGFDDIEETFGPRRQPSNNGAYDWHRGIDIDGARGRWIVAARAGVLEKYTYSTSGGYTVVLRHAFDPPVNYGGRTLSSFYTWYLHLEDSQVPQWVKDAGTNGLHPAVAAGEVIGYMGNSGQGPGGAYAIHLHFELRVGTQSSLEFQLQNFATNSSSFYGFDPHMHPLLLYPPLPVRPVISQTQPPSATNDARYLLVGPSDDNPNLNRVEVRVIDRLTGGVVRTHVLDLNQRIGFDASSTAALDTQDLTRPYFAPLYFTDAQTDYQTELVVPTVFLAPLDLERHSVHVMVADIWGKTAEHPAPPVLRRDPGPGPLQLAWPVEHWGFQLERSDTVNPGAAWSPVGGAPAVENGLFRQSFPLDGGSGFLRLRRP